MTTAQDYFIFTVSQSSDGWLYRLVPIGHFDKSKLSGSDLKALTNIEQGIQCRESGVESLKFHHGIVAYLMESLQECYRCPALRPLTASFQDWLLLWQPNERLYGTIVKIEINNKQEANSLWAAYLLFSSLNSYLSESPESTRIAQAYVAWQRFNLIKALWKLEQEKENEQDGEKKRLVLASEFVSAYRALTTILLDEVNRDACQILWEEGYYHCHDSNPEMKRPVRMRQQLRLSMFLDETSDNEASDITLSEYPLRATSCFEDRKSKKEVHKSRKRENLRKVGIYLHPFFQQEDAKLAVRRLIHEELLPRYDLDTTLSLTSLLMKRELAEESKRAPIKSRLLESSGWVGKWSLIISVPIGFFLILLLVIAGSFNFSWMKAVVDNSPHAIIIFSLPVALGLVLLGARGAINMLLPRIMGGLAIGYFPLLMAAESWYLAVYMAQHPKLWLCEWSIILVMVSGYFYRQAYPIVLEFKEAFCRSLKVLIWAVVQSVFAGFIFILLSAPIYRQLDYDPMRVDSQPQTSKLRVPHSGLNPASPAQGVPQMESEKEASYALSFDNSPNLDMKYESEKRSVEEGLMPIDFWFNTKFPVSALLTFAPISLLLGIILQILWEGKSVTASVWPSDSR
ncbi:MAG: hypothetical protein IPM66_22325 [Acidobacteriota bacterium]|nr:MAG: hypothetical protein IPM66_22325 [Acidobacteriota bacterium]